MKTIRFFVGLAFVLFASFFVVSCNDDSEETFEQQWASVLDNHGSNYDFSDGGKCFGAGGGISKENFDKMFIGHGWKHYGTTLPLTRAITCHCQAQNYTSGAGINNNSLFYSSLFTKSAETPINTGVARGEEW